MKTPRKPSRTAVSTKQEKGNFFLQGIGKLVYLLKITISILLLIYQIVKEIARS